MQLHHLDEQRVAEILAFGGTELREELCSDLERCATRLRDSIGAQHEAPRLRAEMQRQILHELRGIAATIGAAPLAAFSKEVENQLQVADETMIEQACAKIAETCLSLSRQIAGMGA